MLRNSVACAQVAVYNYQKLQVLRAKAKQSAGKDAEKPGRASEAALEPEKQALLPDDKVAVQAYTNFRCSPCGRC